MKFLFLSLFVLILSGCASTPMEKPKVDEGISCAKMTDKDDEMTCILLETTIDRTRWHYLRPWKKDSLGEMPELQ